MSSSYTGNVALAAAGPFRNQIRGWMIDKVFDTLADTVDNPLFQQRRKLAVAVLNDRDEWHSRFCEAIASRTSIDGTTDPDSEIRTRDTEVWDNLCTAFNT